MPFSSRGRFEWRLRTRTLALGARTAVMGIVNVTPDSFSDGGKYYSIERAVEHGLALLDEGADLLDLGGESTRQNATPVTPEEEQERVMPVLAAILKARPGTIISVDTYHVATAEAALEAGAEIINDVSGMMWEPDMADVIAKHKPGVVLMHTRGKPQEWGALPRLQPDEVLPLVGRGLMESVALARAAGVREESIVLDPGFGFGKMGDDNFALHCRLDRLQGNGFPMLVGTSRKGFLKSRLREVTAEGMLAATTASNVAAVLSGAHVVRVHDVAAARAAVDVADAILNAR